MSEWRRLHPRVIWVDLVRSVLSLLPAVTAIAVFGVDPGAGSLWPLLAVAAAGVLGAAGDAVRWAFTRYRITPSYVERKTGVLVRAHRSIQRDRIRSVDVEGRLRHRLAGLRVVKIGAGQQSAAGESALSLDAVSVAEAESLQRLLLRADAPDAKDAPDTEVPADAGAATEAEAPAGAETGADGPAEVYARFQPGWFVYNMFNVWAYVFAIGWMLSGIFLEATIKVSVRVC